MKKIITLSLLLFSSCIFSQNYNLDPAFGNNGIQIFQNSEFSPIDGLLINNNYYFISSSQLIKMNYNGSRDTSFGTDGTITINVNQNPNSGQTSYIKGFKFIDNYLYIYGWLYMYYGPSFIYKIDLNGNLDSAFGTNGVAIINFGGEEKLADFVADGNGNLFCVGSRRPANTNYNVLVYFKINSVTGALNTSFDSNGYKEYGVYPQSSGNFIQKNEDSFLLAGWTTIDGESRVFVSKINTNGSPVSSFGSNGNKLFPPMSPGTSGAGNMQFYNDELYVLYYWGFSFLNNGTNFVKYNLTTGQKIFENPTASYTYFKVMDDGIYKTGIDNCGYSSGYGCGRSFVLRKLNFDGTPYTGFQNGGNFSYSFNSTTDSTSGVFIKDDTGKILIGGNIPSSAGNTIVGNTFIRLSDSTLNTANSALSDVPNIYPNPFTDRITIGSEVKEVAIFDISGRNVGTPTVTAEGGQTTLFPNIAQQGIYILKATTADGRQIIQKIIKE